MLKKQKKSTTELTPEQAEIQRKKYEYVIQNKKTRQAVKHRKAVKWSAIIVVLLLLLALIPFAFYVAVNKMVEYNNMQILVERSGIKVLSLSHSRDMQPGSEVIEITGPEKMTNTTFASGKSLAGNTAIEDKFLDILATDGSFTFRDDYFVAGTFYMRNVSDKTQLYGEKMHLDKATFGAQHALRVMVVKNDEISVYATPQRGKDKDGNDIVLTDEEGNTLPEKVVPMKQKPYSERKIAYDENGNRYIQAVNAGEYWTCKNFYDDEFVVNTEGREIAPGEIVKYTVIIWFEGYDAQCVDDILNGEIKLSMSFSCAE